ncbi:MAG: DoxX family protein [Saprospiraceae bacterium]|nr:DoxX family protein [Saprospiraceae bacterium]
MNAVTGLGKYLFSIPIFVFGIFHFLNAEGMGAMSPFGGKIMIYITGACLILFSLSVFIGKLDKLAAVLLCVFLLSCVFLVHLDGFRNGNQVGTTSFLKDIALAGAALMYAHSIAKDNSIIG